MAVKEKLPADRVPAAVVVVETLMLPDVVIEELVVDAAVMVTVPVVEGAVKVVDPPLGVWAGLKEPHDPVGLHVQSTPPRAVSFETVALITAVPPGVNVAGGAVANAMLNVPDPETVTGAVATLP